MEDDSACSVHYSNDISNNISTDVSNDVACQSLASAMVQQAYMRKQSKSKRGAASLHKGVLKGVYGMERAC
eukprot:20635-Heterococcus_DN1.PRE.4